MRAEEPQEQMKDDSRGGQDGYYTPCLFEMLACLDKSVVFLLSVVMWDFNTRTASAGPT